jgi:prepilin-type N-terminal cleavage/methylation domain-containing protein
MRAEIQGAGRGMTLIEVTIVMALATLVVMGMISFYINSQSMWMAGSSQALAQRDGTLLIEAVSDRVRPSCAAQVIDSPDPLHQGLVLYDPDGAETWRFWWNAPDSLVHQGPGLGQDKGPVVASRVTRFQLDTLSRLVEIRLVELRSGQGELIRMSSAAALHNRRPQ